MMTDVLEQGFSVRPLVCWDNTGSGLLAVVNPWASLFYFRWAVLWVFCLGVWEIVCLCLHVSETESSRPPVFCTGVTIVWFFSLRCLYDCFSKVCFKSYAVLLCAITTVKSVIGDLKSWYCEVKVILLKD